MLAIRILIAFVSTCIFTGIWAISVLRRDYKRIILYGLAALFTYQYLWQAIFMIGGN